MSSTGIYYYADLINFNTTGIRIVYDFDKNNGNLIQSNGNSIFSGELSSIGNFWANSGSGYITGQNISIKNVESGLNSSRFTHIFSYNKEQSGSCILFSNFTGDNIYSGFEFGVNDANFPYLKTYDNKGFVSKTFNINLFDDNILAITYANGLFCCNKYDFNSNKIVSDKVSLNYQYFLPSNNWNLCSNFTGYLDKYIFINEYFGASNLETLLSGLFSNGSGDLNNDFINRFGADSVILNEPLDNDDVVEYQIYNRPSTFINKAPVRTNNKLKIENDNQINLFFNGLILLNSGYITTGDYYNQGISVLGDYSQINDNLYLKELNKSGYIYNVNTGVPFTGILILTGQTETNIPINFECYLNGQKLASGIDYNGGTGNTVTLLENSIPLDTIIFFVKDWDACIISGNQTKILDNNIYNTNIYINGIKQTNYILSSSISLLNNNKIIETGLHNLYNNDRNFLE